MFTQIREGVGSTYQGILGTYWYVSNVSIIFYCSMPLYYPFWMCMGFTLHFYIIFGTHLLTGGPARIAVFFAYFSISKKRNIKRSPNGMKPSGAWFLEQTWSRGLGVQVKKQSRKPRGWRARLPLQGAPPILWAPRASTNVLLPPIYTHIPRNHQGSHRRNISSTVTFCIREIPSWSRRWHSAEGGIHHGGLLHQHHSPSDELWVVYHRPSGP